MSSVILGWAVLINGSSKPTKNHLNLSQNLRIGFILLKTFEIDHFCSDCRNNFLTMLCFVKTLVISVQVWNYVLFCGHQQMCLCYTCKTYSQTYMYLSHFMSYLFPIMSQVLSHIFCLPAQPSVTITPRKAQRCIVVLYNGIFQQWDSETCIAVMRVRQ